MTGAGVRGRRGAEARRERAGLLASSPRRRGALRRVRFLAPAVRLERGRVLELLAALYGSIEKIGVFRGALLALHRR